MKKRINLFSQRRKIVLGGKFLLIGRKIVNRTFTISMVMLAICAVSFLYLSLQIKAVTKTQLDYQKYISANAGFNKEIQSLTHKLSLLKIFLKEDADGYSYYQNLMESLNLYGFGSNLANFEINTAKEAAFSLEFSSYDEAIAFLTLLENKSMTDRFERISLNSFDITQKSGEIYTVSIDGKFNDLNAEDSN